MILYDLHLNPNNSTHREFGKKLLDSHVQTHDEWWESIFDMIESIQTLRKLFKDRPGLAEEVFKCKE